MKLSFAKLIAVNILIFILLLVAVELAFRGIETVVNLSPVERIFKLKTPATFESRMLETHNHPVIKLTPEKFKYFGNPEFLKYKRSQIKRVSSSLPPLSKEKSDVTHVKATFEGTDLTLYEVDYVKEANGRRHVENQERKTKANKFVLAFGCSFTFGEGLAQGMDYPSQLAAKLDSSWKVYNFGVSGSGPNDDLEKFDRLQSHYLKGVREEEGVFVWFMLSNHLLRLLCPWTCYFGSYNWIQKKREYEFVDGKFKSQGSFEESTSLKRKIFSLASKSHFIQHYGFPLIPSWDKGDYEFFVKTLEEITLRIKEKRIKKKYVVIDSDFPNYPILKALLLDYGFEPIEFFNTLSAVPTANLFYPVDGHPTSEHNWYLSEVLKWHITEDWRKLNPR